MLTFGDCGRSMYENSSNYFINFSENTSKYFKISIHVHIFCFREDSDHKRYLE